MKIEFQAPRGTRFLRRYIIGITTFGGCGAEMLGMYDKVHELKPFRVLS